MNDSTPKPADTVTTGTLHFHQLSGEQFERLCLWLIRNEGYQRVEHLGAAGSDQGRDILAWRDGKEWAFQCKNVQRFGPSQARWEVDKVLALPPNERPEGLFFLLTCHVSAKTRRVAEERCGGEMECRFWALTELDERTRRYPEIVQIFFGIPRVPTPQAPVLSPEESQRVLAAYRQHVLADTRLVELAGIPLPKTRTGEAIHLDIPLDRVYIRIQALAEERRHADEASEQRTVEQRAERLSSLASRIRPRLFRRSMPEAGRRVPRGRGAPGVLTMMHTLGEYFYRRGEVYRSEARPDPVDPEAALAQHGRLVLLGAPGSGKTTLLRYLARQAARDAGGPVPVLVKLREYAADRADGGRRDLEAFALDKAATEIKWPSGLSASVGGLSRSAALRQALASEAAAGRVLWLVDALDEARGWRAAAAREAARLNGSLVLTSRPAGYERTGLGAMPHFEVLALSPEDTEAYCRNWFDLLAAQRGESEAWVAARVGSLREQLAGRPRIAMLTRNPLLLTFLVVLASDEQARALPTRRADLYRRYVEELLTDWETLRHPEYVRTGQPVLGMGALASKAFWTAALAGFYRLGWRLHLSYYGGKGGGLPVRENLEDDLAASFRQNREELISSQAPILAEAVIDFWLEAGLLDRWRLAGQEYLAFRHLTFQEYAAARILADLWPKHERWVWRFLRPRLHHYAWREVVLLLGGILTSEQEKAERRRWAERLVRRLLRARSRYNRELCRNLHLAAEVVGEGAAVDERLLQRLVKRLSRLAAPRPGWAAAVILLIEHVLGWVLLFLVLPWWAALLVALFLWGGLWLFTLMGELPRVQSVLWLPTRILGLWPGRAEHVAALGHLGQVAEPQLCEVAHRPLAYENTDVLMAALSALGHLGGERVLEALARSIMWGSESLSQVAIAALGQLGESDRSLLLHWLVDGDWTQQQAAIRILGHLGSSEGDEQVVEAYCRALRDADEYVGEAIANALESLGWQPGKDEVAVRYWIAKGEWERVIGLGEVAILPLIEDLRAGEMELREQAAGALEALDWQPGQDTDAACFWVAMHEWDRAVQYGANAIEPLLHVVSEGHEDKQRAAAKALERIGEPAMKYLLESLGGDSTWAASRALGHIAAETGDPRIFSVLMEALKDGNLGTHNAAASALGFLGELALPALTEALGAKDPWTRRAVMEGLVRIGEPAMDLLTKALDDKSGEVRRVAVRGLAQIGKPALVPLIKALQDEDQEARQTAVEGLVDIGEPAIASLVEVLGHQDEGIRHSAQKALVDLGTPAFSTLVDALDHESLLVRQAAAGALGQIGDEMAIEPLLRVLGGDGEEPRRAAAEALASLDWQPGDDILAYRYWIYREKEEYLIPLMGEGAVEFIARSLSDDNQAARRAAARMLGQYGEPAVEFLLPLLSDSDQDVCRVAAESLAMVDWQPGQDEYAARYWVALGEWDQAARLGQVALGPLLDARWQAHDEDYDAMMDALVRIGEPAVERLLLELETSVKPEHVRLFVGALGQIGDPRAVDPLCRRLFDSESSVRRVATEALGNLADRLPSSEALRVARALWWRLTDSGSNSGDPFEPTWDVAQAAYNSLRQIATRLTDLAVRSLPSDDPTRSVR